VFGAAVRAVVRVYTVVSQTEAVRTVRVRIRAVAHPIIGLVLHRDNKRHTPDTRMRCKWLTLSACSYLF
jgi:hypothetical protein